MLAKICSKPSQELSARAHGHKIFVDLGITPGRHALRLVSLSQKLKSEPAQVPDRLKKEVSASSATESSSSSLKKLLSMLMGYFLAWSGCRIAWVV